MSILVNAQVAPSQKAGLEPLPCIARALPPQRAEHITLLRANCESALHTIANDLRRLAQDLDLLEESNDVPQRLAAVVGAVMAAMGRRTPTLALESIVEAVCAAFCVTHDEIISRRRGQHVALARQVAIYLIREITDYSFPRIGAYFNRDHSTAIHNHTQIARRVTAEAPFRAVMGKLKNSLPPIQTISRSTMEI